ncbi:TolC family protein [Ohtaekwangia kribbensis]|uniref:TolC family protein n=1 Tax=Ohtaekwangia kribbensis TaxID=688913 RepID=A0ABW3K0N0_9BACT
MISFIERKSTFFNRFAFAAFVLVANTASAQEHLNLYINQALQANQGIKQQNFQLEKSLFALKEAKGMFLPSVTFSTTYTKADGGRTIDFPTGDLLNQTYSTLNQLTGTNSFPQLENQSILLNPDNFYDAKFRTSMPLFNAELIYNKRIKQQQVELQRAEIALYKRELIKDVKTAYYQYAKAVNAVTIYQSSLQLVEEGKRINTILLKNEKANRTAVIRSENEVFRINAALTAALENRKSARAYFNFLVNRPLTDSIVLDEINVLPQMDSETNDEVGKREELLKLGIAKEIDENITGLSKAYIVPNVNTFLDLGSQAFDWKYNDKTRYYLFGVSLSWNIFSAGVNTYKIKQARAEQHSLVEQTDYIEDQLKTELYVRKNDFQSALAQYNAAQSQLKTAETYYNDELKLYKEGLAIYIELLDAQNQLINARLDSNIALYNTCISYAAIERASASFNIQ